MKKYCMELAIVAVFFIFIIFFLWENLSGANRFLPPILLGICAAFLILTIFSFSKKENGKFGLQEVYFPKYFTQAAITCVITIVVVVLAAVILNKDDLSKTLDFTKNKINSLSDASEKFLGSLNKNVQIICVPSPNPTDNYCEQSLDLISLYSKKSPHIINLKVLNLANKALLEQVQPSGFSRVILITDNNKTELDGGITEQKITNALINLIKYKKVVYFYTGFGEPSINATDSSRNYSDIASALQSKAYQVKEWSLKQGELPADARVLVMGDNSVAYTAEVQSRLQSFVDKGGKVLLIVNPYREQGLLDFYRKLGLKLDDVLLTLNANTALGQQVAKQNLNRPPVMVTNFNLVSAITKVIAQVYGPQALMPVDGARPISILPSGSKSKPTTTVLMSAYSAAPITLTAAKRNKIDLDGPFNLVPDAKYDADALWNLGVDVEVGKSEVVVYGFSLVNQYSKSVPISEQLIPLTVAHLYQDLELVSIPQRDFAPKQFNLSRNPGGWILFFAGILPLLTAIMGFSIWMKRRTA